MDSRTFNENIIIWSSKKATKAHDIYEIEMELLKKFPERNAVLIGEPKLILDQIDVKTYKINYYFSDSKRLKTESKAFTKVK